MPSKRDLRDLAHAFDAADLSMSRDALRLRAFAALQVLRYTSDPMVLRVWLHRVACDLVHAVPDDVEVP